MLTGTSLKVQTYGMSRVHLSRVILLLSLLAAAAADGGDNIHNPAPPAVELPAQPPAPLSDATLTSTVVDAAGVTRSLITKTLASGKLMKCCDGTKCGPSDPGYAGNCDVLHPGCATVQCPAYETAFPPGMSAEAQQCKSWVPLEEECRCVCRCVCIYTLSSGGQRVLWL